MADKGADSYENRINSLKKAFPNLHVQSLTPNLLALHTKIRNSSCPRQDFVFYSQRIFRLLLEDALSLLPHSSHEVQTPTNCTFHGCAPEIENQVCGVSILRAGSAMEGMFLEVLRNAPIGHILIQRDEESKEKRAMMFYAKVPSDVASKQVLLMDPMLGTGGSAVAAVDALVERGVNPENIVFVNLLSCYEGIRAVFTKYPGLKMITSMVDEILNEDKYLCPGLGDFGDIFFGTIHKM